MNVYRFTADPNDPASMKALQEFADASAKATQAKILRVSDELYISERCALEAELIRLHAIGQSPNIFEWP